MKMPLKCKTGFTLVELIIVIAVVALLAVGAIFAIMGIQRNARRVAVASDAKLLVQGLNLYNGRMYAARIEDAASIGYVQTGNEVRVVLLTDATAGEVDFGVSFSSLARFNQVMSVIYWDPVGVGGDVIGVWRIDMDLVAAIN